MKIQLKEIREQQKGMETDTQSKTDFLNGLPRYLSELEKVYYPHFKKRGVYNSLQIGF